MDCGKGRILIRCLKVGSLAYFVPLDFDKVDRLLMMMMV